MDLKERAAMQQALEALLRSIPDEALLMYVPEEADEFHRKAITALREALSEQAEQSQLADATLEPVAWQEVVSNVANNLGEMAAQAHTQRFCDGINAEVDKLFALVATPVEHVGEINQFGVFVSTLNFRALPIGTKFYAAPVRTKDLTDDEIMKINVDTASIVPTCDRQFHFARAVIAADREKNK